MSQGQSNEVVHKECRTCRAAKPLDDFYLTASGRPQPYCKPCFKQRVTKWQKANPDKVKATKAAYHRRHKERDRRKNAEKVNTRKRRKNAESGGRYWAMRRAKRKAAKLNRTPSWACAATLRKIYLERPDDHHVDHVIPLRGKRVSGLHVPENLQYLPGHENLKKQAQFKPQWEILRPDLLL